MEALARAHRLILAAGAGAAALLLGAMAALVTADVVGRNVGLGALPWIVEVSEYSLPLATFLVAPWLLARGTHVRVDALLTVLPGGLGRALDRGADLLGLAVSVIFAVYGARTILSSARQGSMVFKALVFPEWWLYAPVPICFGLLAIEFGRRLARAAAPAASAPHG
ncbi:MAG: TRAP transporter small permease [candidate division NC10 bacterium]|jgi:TRAP-type C4-dicarboxylate transport system permease small subunit